MLVKKMRLLQRKGGEMEQKKVMEKTKKYLTSVGDSISDVANMKGRNSARNVQRLRQRLWQFVATYTENTMEGSELEKVYNKISSNGKAAQLAVADVLPGHADAVPGRAQGTKRAHDGASDDAPAAKWGRYSEEPAWEAEPRRHAPAEWSSEQAAPGRERKTAPGKAWEEDDDHSAREQDGWEPSY